jgi:outer membrane protein TolC
MKKAFLLIMGIIPLALFSLNLQQAYDLALQKNPTLQAARESSKAAKLAEWKSFLNLTPQATATAGYTQFDPKLNMNMQQAEDSQSYGFTISQPVFNGGKIWLGYRINRGLSQIAKHNYDQHYFDTIASVENYYFSVLKNQKLLEIAQKSLNSASANLETAQVKFQSGTISKADLLKFQAEKANKRLSLLQTRNLYNTSRRALANFLQIKTNFELANVEIDSYQNILQEFQSLQNPETISQKLWDLAKKQNPSLQIAATNTAINKKQVLMTAGNFLPSISLSYNKNWSKYNFQDDYENSGQFGINASMPIFPIADNGLAYAEAKSKHRQAKYELQSASDQIQLGLENSFYNLLNSAQAVKAAEISLNFAKETYAQMQERFRNDIITSTDLLDAEIALTSAQNQHITAFFDFLQARTNLKKMLGSDDDILELMEEK